MVQLYPNNLDPKPSLFNQDNIVCYINIIKLECVYSNSTQTLLGEYDFFSV
jgi:hypothetical protein